MIIKHVSPNNGVVNFNSTLNKYDFFYPCENYSVCSPYNITLGPGYYYLEAYGASGGNHHREGRTARGGYGGYAAGVYRVSNLKTIYLHIGGHADLDTDQDIIYRNIYNGGSYGVNNFDAPGGGATDFREKSGNWSDNNSLYSRIVMAGAGGGGRVEDNICNGGNGGGINGQPGQGINCSSQFGTQDGSSATTCISSVYYRAGTFGCGGLPGWTGAGGGWYGGGVVQLGGGGSGHTQNVISYGGFEIKNDFSDNFGYGRASITVIELFDISQNIGLCFNIQILHVLMTFSYLDLFFLLLNCYCYDYYISTSNSCFLCIKLRKE
ncbi:hypothetical protein TVAG_013470 [Trichomonas vaginalis G3]|uniref:receptor protein-tyrosine kinase n=1 Tax=Trichomonas vaginalis (strain ATCC PRA-98 / G3) TaxID=412133 RepID=A2DDA3_TRIV3|nr:glycine-rich protein family [Trichomonas vaginalis G3]EAY21582.1 hypothetical protein TVAG_013470 [Trichomonas vaginalis G3]KAI5489742.1 glycine-rich protein family [Trichomonas vaginalis G3]|eukprot:XP_001582568.1 hypothetical protein [Trichomonas vaginalis G3]